MQVKHVDDPMVGQGARGSDDLAFVSNGAPEAQPQTQELADTPVKAQLRREVGQLWEALKVE